MSQLEQQLHGPIVRLEDICVRFGNLEVHKNISISINEGEIVTLLGPSGTGKTILLKLIIGLLRPSSGSVQVMGEKICSVDETRLREMRRKIGMLFQGAALFDSLSVYDNIAYSLHEYGELEEFEIKKIVEEMLNYVGLPEIIAKFPTQLSGGQKKRVGLARALASYPKILLFDEPTTGLDPTAVRLIDELITKLKRDFQITCIVVTHDIESAKRFSDRMILLDNGKVIADGPAETLSKNNPDVVRFIEGRWRED